MQTIDMPLKKTYNHKVSFLSAYRSRLGWKITLIHFFMNVVLVALFSFAIFVSQGELISQHAPYSTKDTVSELLQQLRYNNIKPTADSSIEVKISRIFSDSLPLHLFFKGNQITYSSSKNLVLPPNADNEARRARLLREQAGTEYVLQPDFEQNKFRFYIPLDEFGLPGQTALLEKNFETMLALLRRFTLIILITGATITALHIGLALLLHKMVVNPIGVLTKAAQKISDGNYEHAVPAEFHDEIGILGSTFNAMTEKIRMQIEDLNSKNTELVQANQRIREMAITDELTGLFNRHHLQTSLQAFIQTSDRYNRVMSLLLLDVDHFKKFNDTYGHLVGDQVLKHISGILKRAVRQSDLVARYGGEEMVVVLPETDIKGATVTAEKIRVIIANTPIAISEHQSIRITVSIGVTEFLSLKEESHKTPDIEDLILAADQALYEAKENGRNRVVIHSSPSKES